MAVDEAFLYLAWHLQPVQAYRRPKPSMQEAYSSSYRSVRFCVWLKCALVNSSRLSSLSSIVILVSVLRIGRTYLELDTKINQVSREAESQRHLLGIQSELEDVFLRYCRLQLNTSTKSLAPCPKVSQLTLNRDAQMVQCDFVDCAALVAQALKASNTLISLPFRLERLPRGTLSLLAHLGPEHERHACRDRPLDVLPPRQ